MPDTKITALAAIGANPINVATFPIPMVDLLDTSMAASGTTKKVTVNQILGAGGTATLASATITGDLTVRTNKLAVTSTGVGIGTASPAVLFHAALPAATFGEVGRFYDSSGNGISFTANASSGFNQITSTGSQPLIVNVNSSERYRIASDGVATWSNVGGVAGTAMTLNATGLGVGTSPANDKLLSLGSMGILLSGATSDFSFRNSGGTAIQRLRYTDATGALTIGSATGTAYPVELGGNTTTRAVTIDASSNVGIGVTPSAWSAAGFVQLSNSRAFAFAGAAGDYISNGYFDGSWKYTTTAAVSRYRQDSASHQWYNAPSGTAGNAITFTQAMTLDASGNLLVGTTAAAAGRIDVRRTTVGRGINYFSTASGDLAQVGLYIAKFDNDSTTSQKFIAFSINNDSAGSGQINANGANQAAFGSFSDSRLKENIVSLPSQLDNILSLRPVEFDYKDGSGHQIGFVAQEMQQVYSDAVGESDGFLTVTGWSKTEARLVSAIKELAAKVQALEAKLA